MKTTAERVKVVVKVAAATPSAASLVLIVLLVVVVVVLLISRTVYKRSKSILTLKPKPGPAFVNHVTCKKQIKHTRTYINKCYHKQIFTK